MKVNSPKIIRLKKTKVIIYIEKIVRYFNREANENVIYLLIDFPVKNSNMNIFYERIQINLIEGRTILEIKNIEFDETGIIPREGHYYYLPDALMEGFNWLEYEPNNSEFNNYIALSSEGINKKIKFNNALNFKQFVEVEKSKSGLPKALKIIDKVDLSKVEVEVFNVGQGNWNEICFNSRFLITYDIGASSSLDFLNAYNNVILRQTRNLKIDTLLIPNFEFNKILIISHWDVDHYNGIFDLGDSILESYDYCIVPNLIENKTTQRAFDKLKRNTDVYPIEMNNKGKGRGATSVLSTIYNNKFLKIYKGTKCSNRNKRGLSISLHVKGFDYIFPADHHYNQINDYIIPNCVNSNLNVIVPHHGGRAGNLLLINGWKFCEESIISTNGRYGHPFPNIIAGFKSKFRLVHRTDILSDYYKLL